MTAPPRIASPRRGVVLAAAALVLAIAAPAGAVPTISGADTDVWNASQPEPVYTITASSTGRRVRIFWRVANVDSGDGRSPLTVKLKDLPDGTYTLQASEGTNDDAFSALFARSRTFRVDVTPPTITIAQPQAGAVFTAGQTVLASYACQGAVTCAGPVASGAPIDTGSPGDKGFRVTARDDAGNEAAADADYAVVAGSSRAPAPPTGTTGTATPAAAPRPAGLVTPTTINARRLLPRRGALVATRRPVLRWPLLARARLYNLQVFRLRGARAVKVLSAFPRLTRYRVPPRRLAFGDRYIWRVWPYLSTGYPRRPLGMSFFDVRSRTGS